MRCRYHYTPAASGKKERHPLERVRKLLLDWLEPRHDDQGRKRLKPGEYPAGGWYPTVYPTKIER